MSFLTFLIFEHPYVDYDNFFTIYKIYGGLISYQVLISWGARNIAGCCTRAKSRIRGRNGWISHGPSGSPNEQSSKKAHTLFELLTVSLDLYQPGMIYILRILHSIILTYFLLSWIWFIKFQIRGITSRQYREVELQVRFFKLPTYLYRREQNWTHTEEGCQLKSQREAMLWSSIHLCAYTSGENNS